MSGLIKVLVFEIPYKEFKAQKISLEDIGDVEDIWNFTSDYADHFDCYLFRFNTINPSSPILAEGLSPSSKEPLKEKSLNNKSNEVSNARSTSNCLEKEALAIPSLAKKDRLKKEVKNLKTINCSTSDESLKETNAEKDTIIEELERSNVKVNSELEKTKLDVQMLENQLKTCQNNLKDLNAGSRPQLKKKIKDLENLNVEFKFKEFKWNKTKQDHLSEVASNKNKIKDLEMQMKTLEDDLKVA